MVKAATILPWPIERYLAMYWLSLCRDQDDEAFLLRYGGNVNEHDPKLFSVHFSSFAVKLSLNVLQMC